MTDALPVPSLDRLRASARLHGFPGDDATLGRLMQWLETVLQVGEHVNLTGARNLEQAVDMLGLSALAVSSAWPTNEEPPARVVDLGSGNGLPGIAAALAWPQAEVVLLERRRKKAAAIEVCLAAVPFPGTEVVTADAREWASARPGIVGAVDLVTVRAVGPLADLTQAAARWLRPGGRIVHWKGEGLGEKEIADGARAARHAGLKPKRVRVFPTPPGPGRLVTYRRPTGR